MQDVLAQFEPLLRAVAAQVSAACPPSILQDDLEQIGRISLFRKFGKAAIKEENDSVGYVRALLRNAMWDAVRGREFEHCRVARDADRIDNVELEAVAPVADPFVRRAVRRLPAVAARVIELRFTHDLNQQQVARRMGISRHSVRRAEASGIAALRRQFALAA